MTFTAATVQFRPLKCSPEKNLASLLALCKICAGRGAEIIILPEMCLSGYIFENTGQVEAVAQPAEGPAFQAFAAFCLENSCYISYGFAESSEGSLYNSQNLIGPDGNLKLRYRKVHLYEADQNWSKPGDLGFMSVKTPLGVMGMGICMDINFDDFIEYHIKSSTGLLLFATNWLEQGVDVRQYWRTRLEGFNGTIFISNTYGIDNGILFSGRSSVLHNGLYLASAPAAGNAVLFTTHEINAD